MTLNTPYGKLIKILSTKINYFLKQIKGKITAFFLKIKDFFFKTTKKQNKDGQIDYARKKVTRAARWMLLPSCKQSKTLIKENIPSILFYVNLLN